MTPPTSTPAVRMCDLCGVSDDLPRHSLVLSTDPPIGVTVHLPEAQAILDCPECGPHVREVTATGVRGEPLLSMILDHHAGS